ncbi:hypothetical protein EGW08_008985 [Elysia chlorotica]|uniref:Exonuclease domain-containing protein n=1 Tax=Elysia chlorotica TaxID=188477 RepID=A0A3S1BGA1_ELYCH|nr:hypothetical protein EGW08_008985 [Elysia chlorotica]
MASTTNEPQTIVFFDVEGTGLPFPTNIPKFTELCFLAVSPEDLVKHPSKTPRVINKLSLCFNPEKSLNQSAVEVSGLTYADLQECPTFNEQVPILTHFLEHLPQPVCLVAHNGARYDFPLLAKHLEDAGVDTEQLTTLSCVDTIPIFQALIPRRRYRLDEMHEQICKPPNNNKQHTAESDCKKLMEIIQAKCATRFVELCQSSQKPLHFFTRPAQFANMFAKK